MVLVFFIRRCDDENQLFSMRVEREGARRFDGVRTLIRVYLTQEVGGISSGDSFSVTYCNYLNSFPELVGMVSRDMMLMRKCVNSTLAYASSFHRILCCPSCPPSDQSTV